MKAIRIFERRNYAFKFLPTSICVGISLHTVQIPSHARKPGLTFVRFIHFYIPFFYLSFSYTITRP